MKKLINTQLALFPGVVLAALVFSFGLLQGQNNALHFDGNNDYIHLSPINCMPAANPDFTVEMWFKMQDIQPCEGWDIPAGLFAFHDGLSRFFIGERNGHLQILYSCFLYWGNWGIPVFHEVSTSLLNMLEINKWYALSVVRADDTLKVFLDCNKVFDSAGFFTYETTVFSPSLFEVGKSTPGWLYMEDPCLYWHGEIDEVRLWKKALLDEDIQQLSCKPCLPDWLYYNNQEDLLARWSFDDAIPGGNNTGKSQVEDWSGNNLNCYNPGILHNFSLTGNESNFINSSAFEDFYLNHHIQLRNAAATMPITEICSGDRIHFSIVNSAGFPPANFPGNTTVTWYYSDDLGGSWTEIQPIPGQAPFGDNSFWFGQGQVSQPTTLNNCGLVSEIFRHFRAKISVWDAQYTHSCDFYAETQTPLKICCPVELSMTMTPGPPEVLCASDIVMFNVKVATGLPEPGPTNFVTISWEVIINSDVIPLTGPAYTDKEEIWYPHMSFTQLSPGTVCFRATVSNCACDTQKITKCITIDPTPICGTITGASENLIPTGIPNEYLICPDNDAAIAIETSFEKCRPQWQYKFPNTTNSWANLGFTNPVQNTNVLPHYRPSGSPYLWPAGETCIMYRIACLPLNHPNSGCDTCFSNEIKVCLKPGLNKPFIVGQNPICDGAETPLSLGGTANPGYIYKWYHNGEFLGSGTTYQASQSGRYMICVSEEDTCKETKCSEPFDLDVCAIIASISCPIPDCPCIGDTITLSAAGSYSTCGGTLTFSWKIDGVEVSTDEFLEHVPSPTGTTYLLTVTDENVCIGTKQRTVVPCDCTE